MKYSEFYLASYLLTLLLTFCSEGNLNIKTRMPFGKARMILPRPMFDPAFPMISKVEPCKLFISFLSVASKAAGMACSQVHIC